MKKYYTIKKGSSIDESELDILLYDTLFPNWDTDNNIDFDFTSIGRITSEGEPIQIDNLIKILNELKLKGSNYVSINNHIDHHGYEIDGYNIYVSTEEEISKYLEIKKEKEISMKKSEYEELSKKLEELKKDL